MTGSSGHYRKEMEEDGDTLKVPEGFSPSSFKHQLGLQQIVHKNHQHQHYWKNLKLHPQQQQQHSIATAATTGEGASNHHVQQLPRLLMSGNPPEPIYIPPGASISSVDPQRVEFVLPVHASEKFSLKQWAEIFDTLPMERADKKTNS